MPAPETMVRASAARLRWPVERMRTGMSARWAMPRSASAASDPLRTGAVQPCPEAERRAQALLAVERGGLVGEGKGAAGAHGAGKGGEQPGDDAQQARLADAVRPRDQRALPTAEIEVEPREQEPPAARQVRPLIESAAALMLAPRCLPRGCSR